MTFISFNFTINESGCAIYTFVLRNLLYAIFKVPCVSLYKYGHMSFLVSSDALAGIYKFIDFGKRQIIHSFTAIFSSSWLW